MALPQSASYILELVKNPENGPPELAAAIAPDIGLSSQILRFINSSYFGFSNKVTSIQTALSLVYGRTLRNFILWNTIFALLPDPRCGPFELKKICLDSLQRASFAKVVSNYFSKINSEDIFLNSLFQDIALPILAQIFPSEYAELLFEKQKTQKPLSVLEFARFGWTHADAGAYLAEEWGFDESFCENVRTHNRINSDINIKKCTPEDLQQFLVSLSSLLPSMFDTDWYNADIFFDVFAQLVVQGIPYPDAVFKETETQLDNMLRFSKFGSVPISLSTYHQKYLQTLES